ncbi:hypothetical protein [Aeromonas hydrophila]|uniref:hypothetical protein n=1 Tax=Aeromonas hydrophila TaxID=644 RepID=UPI0012699AA9|nr:hypothetical protein [Aeromonas hydrophila]
MNNLVKNVIDQELTSAGINLIWSSNDINVAPGMKTITEVSSSNAPISEAIINYIFPQVSGEVELVHYTNLTSFDKIIKSEELRLYSMLKRLGQAEFISFINEHNLDGYLQQKNGKTTYQEMMGDLFYTSFTTKNIKDEDLMWRTFGENHAGVKIIFKLKVIEKRAELREIFYHSRAQGGRTLIKNIHEKIYSQFSRHFIIRGISRIGAFYLPLGIGLEGEEEVRLLIKSYGTGKAYDLIKNDGSYDYIPLKIGHRKNEFCDISIVEVQAGSACNKASITNMLNNSTFKGTKVI